MKGAAGDGRQTALSCFSGLSRLPVKQGFSRKNWQVSESNARDILEDAGQAGIPSGQTLDMASRTGPSIGDN
jgi:hypothetical protein